MQPTPEQQEAIDLFDTGWDLAIEAGAGTGKTTTLVQLGKTTDKRGAYVAFNRSIVEEAKLKMPANVQANTAHSLAMRQAGRQFSHRLSSGRMRSDQIARMLGLSHITVRYGQQAKVLQPGFLGSLVMRAVTNFCQSDDPEPTERHVPYVEGIDLPTDDGKRTWTNNDMVRQEVAPTLAKAWADLTAVDGQLPYKHDHYLKFWQLHDPIIPADFVMFDEAQDAAPVMLAAVKAQLERGAQLVFVGDSQQQIYEWRGAVNALAAVPADTRTFLTQSFRFGPAIAEVANLVLDKLGADLRLKGFDPVPSKIAPLDRPVAVLCRTNAKAVETVFEALSTGRRPHLIGGGAEVIAFARAAKQLQQQGYTMFPDLACFQTWVEVQEYVENDPQGDELKLLVGLIDDYGADLIIKTLERMPEERAADIVVSTAHKAKGREWETVQLAGDFSTPTDDALGEWRLLYVAATRAQLTLDVRLCEPLHDLLNPTLPQAGEL